MCEKAWENACKGLHELWMHLYTEKWENESLKAMVSYNVCMFDNWLTDVRTAVREEHGIDE